LQLHHGRADRLRNERPAGLHHALPLYLSLRSLPTKLLSAAPAQLVMALSPLHGQRVMHACRH
jgi:hypothetical protein